jgi:diguanylate cyclase
MPSDTARSRHSRRQLWYALGLFAVIAAIYVNLGHPRADVLYQVVSWTALVAAFLGIRRHCPRRLPWMLILTAYTLFAVGDLIFSLYEFAFELDPYTSLADGVYIAGYVPLGLGLVLIVRRSSMRGGRVLLVDAGIATIPAVVGSWIHLIGPLAADTETTLTERLFATAYPVGDLICLAIVVRLISSINTRSARRQPALTLLVIAVAGTLAGDTGYGFLSLGGYDGPWYLVLDTLFMFSPVGLAFAAWSPSIAFIDEPTSRDAYVLSRRRLLLLALAALATPAILLVQWINSGHLAIPLIVAGTAVSFLLVIARMALLVTALEHSHDELQIDATHDRMTGLPNRHLFLDRLEHVLASDRAGALLFIDLDHFKSINDSLGHIAGDAVLVEIAQRLRESVREADLVGRLAGDEFVVLIDSADEAEVQAVASRLQSQLRVTRAAGDGWIRVTASIGLVRWPAGTPSTHSSALLASADQAMYEAKVANGDCLSVARAIPPGRGSGGAGQSESTISLQPAR